MYYVYLLTNRLRGTFYTGFTSNMPKRMAEHVAGALPGFTRRYGLKKLVYYEQFDDVHEAIRFEKRLKRWPRDYKYKIVEETNPDWLDLSTKFYNP